jgi:hypothetical protein
MLAYFINYMGVAKVIDERILLVIFGQDHRIMHD